MQIVRVATHDGIFHADEVFALAVLKLCLEKEGNQIEIIRTRDLEKIALCDIAVDVGSEYSHGGKKYDHHQKKKPGIRENGIPYAAFGLIWKHYGKKLSTNKKVRESIEKKLVMPIDALDNGVSVSNPIFDGVHEFGASQVISAIGMSFGDEDASVAFEKALEFASLVIRGEITKAKTKIAGERIIAKEIQRQGAPDVLILEEYTNWESAVSKHKNIKLVVFPGKEPARWCIQTARDNINIFDQDRISFPEAWRGLTDEELVIASGIPESVFCHTGGFFAVTRTRDTAIAIAEKTVFLQKNNLDIS